MISHVAELRFYGISAHRLRGLSAAIRSALLSEGVIDGEYDLGIADAPLKFQWAKLDLGDEKPSDSQMWLCRKLFGELKSAIRNDTPLTQRAKILLDDVEDEMKTGNVTKTTISPIINAMKDAIADLDYERNGCLRASE